MCVKILSKEYLEFEDKILGRNTFSNEAIIEATIALRNTKVIEFQLSNPPILCSWCNRHLRMFETTWDESRPETGDYLCEICWLWTK